MGMVIAFPAERPARAANAALAGQASIVILPVIRIERHDDEPTGGFEPDTRSTSGRKRRKR